MTTTKSALQIARATYQPKLPAGLCGNVKITEGTSTESVADHEALRALFPKTYGMPNVHFEPSDSAAPCAPLRVGVILSGGQAPGGHNVICGLFDELKRLNKDSRLYGFLMGPDGLVKHNYKELTKEYIDEYRGTGGFDMIGSGRTKLEQTEQFEESLKIIRQLGIGAIVIIGGDDSNTNAAMLAEYYAQHDCGVQVIGCPKTIDGDLKNAQIEASFGFDTACKVYSELIGNLQRDANSSRKYWHLIKLMGRSASHIALECALQTQPNVCLISEEVEAKNMSIDDIVTYLCEVIAARAEDGNNFGSILIPEGIIEFIPEMKSLIAEINDLIAQGKDIDCLSPKNAAVYQSLPKGVAKQLTLARDPHGNVSVSLIETEKMLSTLIKEKLAQWKEEGRYSGKFSYLRHFLGYEGRCAAPSNYDANYCYALGCSAAQLIRAGKTGYMAVVQNTTAPASQWQAGGVPLTSMMNMEVRGGVKKPVIRKALVDLNGKPFLTFAAKRKEWERNTSFVYPGPIQYWGPSEVCDRCTITLSLERGE